MMVEQGCFVPQCLLLARGRNVALPALRRHRLTAIAGRISFVNQSVKK